MATAENLSAVLRTWDTEVFIGITWFFLGLVSFSGRQELALRTELPTILWRLSVILDFTTVILLRLIL